MLLTETQQAEMLHAASPLIVWMKEHCHPHCVAHVDGYSVELTEGIAREIKQ